jgi:hypothetical protein
MSQVALPSCLQLRWCLLWYACLCSIISICNDSLFRTSQMVSPCASLHRLLDAKLLFLPHPLVVMVAYARYTFGTWNYTSTFSAIVWWRPRHFYFLQEVLYCAKKAGVTHILKAGGAQVVADLRLSCAPLFSSVHLMVVTFRQSQLWHGELRRAQRYLKYINFLVTCLKSVVIFFSVYCLAYI